jgi:hypothetical protein
MPRTLTQLVSTLFIGSLALACSDDSGDGNGAPSVSFATDIHPIFVENCVPCHSVGEQDFPGHGASDVDESYAEATGDGQLGQKVYERILIRTDPPDVSQIMPPFCGNGLDDGDCLTTAEYELIEQWVAAGTPP